MSSKQVKNHLNASSSRENDAAQIAREIDKAANVIRQKHRELKNSDIVQQEYFNKKYNPIIEPLNKVINTKRLFTDNVYTTPNYEVITKQEDRGVGGSGDITPDKNTFPYEELLKTEEGHDTINTYLETSIGPEARSYLKHLIFDGGQKALSTSKFDQRFGVRRENNQFLIGDEIVTFDNDDNLFVKNKTYHITPGLAQLLFLIKPKKHTTDDQNKYGEILYNTNAHQAAHNAHISMASKRSVKYKKIIQPFFAKNKSTHITGKGTSNLLHVSKAPVDYVYYDDPNELVTRLHLLHSSREVGHTGHENEIASIEEELRERKLII